MCNSSLLLWDHQATGRDCSLSTTSVDRRSPLSMPRAEVVTALLARRESTCYEKLRFRPFFRSFYPHPAHKSSLRVGRVFRQPSLGRCPLANWPTLRSPFDPAKPGASAHFTFPDITG